MLTTGGRFGGLLFCWPTDKPVIQTRYWLEAPQRQRIAAPCSPFPDPASNPPACFQLFALQLSAFPLRRWNA